LTFHRYGLGIFFVTYIRIFNSCRAAGRLKIHVRHKLLIWHSNIIFNNSFLCPFKEKHTFKCKCNGVTHTSNTAHLPVNFSDIHFVSIVMEENKHTRFNPQPGACLYVHRRSQKGEFEQFWVLTWWWRQNQYSDDSLFRTKITFYSTTSVVTHTHTHTHTHIHTRARARVSKEFFLIWNNPLNILQQLKRRQLLNGTNNQSARTVTHLRTFPILLCHSTIYTVDSWVDSILQNFPMIMHHSVAHMISPLILFLILSAVHVKVKR
jgi:hypothetical protein